MIDQLGSDTFLQTLPWLDEHGTLRSAVERGAFFERGQYPYAGTLTAPGHAALFTGAPPRESGISSNEVWNFETEQAHAAVEDPSYPVLGHGELHIGPGRLRAETVAASLKARFSGQAKVVSLSVKDRAAIYSVGREADLALWYDAELAGFTSSTAWVDQLPAWLVEYQSKHPIAALLEPWHPLYPERYLAQLGADEQDGEVDVPGFGRAFPHDVRKTVNPRASLKFTPQLSEYLLALSAVAAERMGLGADAVPDLLVVSVSGTDYTGHLFGPRSWEYVDHLIRVDRALGRLIAELQERGPVVTLLTSDHGVAVLPESVRDRAAGRLFTQAMTRDVNAALSERFGEGQWVAATLAPFVYLSKHARQHERFEEVRAAAKRRLEQIEGVATVFVPSRVREDSTEPFESSVALTLAPGFEADLYVVPKPEFVFDSGMPPGAGTHHGSPHDYDRQVPILIWGDSVSPRREAEPVSMLRVAPTLAKLLGVPAPRQSREAPLPF